MDIKELIHKSRPTVKESTIKQYESLLKILQKHFKTTNYKFLNNVDEVILSLEDKHFTTQKNYYNAIIVLLLALEGDKSVIEKYIVLRDELSEKYNNQTNKISEKQKPNFATMEEIDTMLSLMLKEIKLKRLKSKGQLTGKERELIMMYTIFNMLKYIPTRNDLAFMTMTTPKQYSKQDKQYNYLVVGRDKLYYMLNNYKTNKTYGFDKRIDVPEDLMKIIRIYIRATEKKTGDFLFTTSTGNPISRNVMSQMLLKTSKKYIGKSVSTTIMRKVVVSDKFGPGTEFAKLKEEQVNLASAMCHSVATQNAIYSKEA